jgi:hypothetical protein
MVRSKCCARMAIEERALADIDAGCHSSFTPAVLAMLRSKDIERINDFFVDARRSRALSDVLDEFTPLECTSGATLRRHRGDSVEGATRSARRAGKVPLGLLLRGALVFDHHSHLRFDMAPAVGRDVAPSDDNRMLVVVEWMLAVLGN